MRYVFYLLVLCLLIVGIAAFVREKPECPAIPHRLNRQSYDAIIGGMTRAEVEEIIGVPAGDYSTLAVETPWCGTGLPSVNYDPEGTAQERSEWKGNDCFIEIEFDAADRVVRKTFGPCWRSRRGAKEEVLRWFGL